MSGPSVPPPVPLHPGQRGLWFLHALAPRDTAYNTCTAIDLTGPLCLPALRAAVAGIGRAHDALRAMLSDVDGEPVQSFADGPSPLRVVDLGGLPDGAREAAAAEQLRRLAATPFDLAAGPPVRWLLLRYGPRRHVLVLDVHHIVFDRDSLAVVCAALERWYAAGLAGQPVPVGPARGDTALACAAWDAGERAEAGLRYWRTALAGVPPETRLFPAREAPGRRAPVRELFALAAADVADLARVCAAERTTTFAALLALVGALVGRYAGQRDVVLGAPVSLRDVEEHRDVVGMMINTVPLRLRLSRDATFRDLLRQARDVVLDALEHRRVPLHRVVDSLGVARGPDASPLFQVLLAYQRDAPEPRLPGLRAVARPVPASAAKYGLTVTVTEGTAGLVVELEADARDCPPERLAACARHLATLARSAGAAPDRPVDSIDLLDPAERAAALAAGRGPVTPRPPGAGVHGLVTGAARARPDAVAVHEEMPDGGVGQLSYRALERAAARLARALVAAGVRPDQPVGILQRRGTGLVVSHLAALRAGGAILPLEPSDPAGRLARLVTEAGLRTVVTHRGMVARCDRLGVAALAVEDFLGPAGPAAPPRPVPGARAAYVICTSGSTGVPKAVVVPHEGLVNRLRWLQDAHPLAAGERVLAKTQISFDVSLAELFGPLIAGATLVIAEPGGERDPQYLARVIDRERIAAVHFVPSMLAPFLVELEATGRRLPALRTVACSGEPLSAGLIRRAATVLDAVVLNLYGPAEASVEVTGWPTVPDQPVSVGTPSVNVECHVFDDRLRPVPAWVVGELHLGGACLARGYLNRPGLTAAAFWPAPAGARLYRTGDYGRRARDGSLEVIGRRDHQVKVGGRRVELGEVTEALRRRPGVLDAAVTFDGDRLAAFVVLDGATATTIEEVLAGLRGELPGYLVPSVAEVLPRLPTTANGKVDRRALADRVGALAPPGGSGTPPRTELELRLARAWSDVLGVSAVGVHERFFDLGGTSLTLLRLHRLLAGTVARELTVRDLYRFPTVATLAAYLAEGGSGEASGRPAARGARRRAVVANRAVVASRAGRRSHD